MRAEETGLSAEQSAIEAEVFRYTKHLRYSDEIPVQSRADMVEILNALHAYWRLRRKLRRLANAVSDESQDALMHHELRGLAVFVLDITEV